MSSPTLRVAPNDFRRSQTPVRQQETDENLARELRTAIAQARQFFFQHQHPDGYWVAELEGDVLLESEAILLLTHLGEENGELAANCAKYILEKQLPDGGWGMYTGAPSDVTNTVKSYFALKLVGHNPSSPQMQAARRRVLELGGAEKVNSFTRFYLALLGQIPYEKTPAVPPQMMLLPTWFPVNIYAMSSWSRAIFVALSIVSALQPITHLPPERGIRELFIRDPKDWEPVICPGKKRGGLFSWDYFFRCTDKVMWKCRQWGFTPFRKIAVQKAINWTLEHFKDSDGPGAIQPPIVWAWIALRALEYDNKSPEVQYCRDQFNSLILRNVQTGSVRIQPCKSPVWDTVLTLKAMMVGGMTAEHPAIRKSLNWVQNQQIHQKGDWSHTVRGKPGGWAFEFNNAFYPDNDDTAMALMVLAGKFTPDTEHRGLPPALRLVTSNTLEDANTENVDVVGTAETSAVVQRGLAWLLSMQNRDGGWGAFDKNNTLELLCKVPFADHNAMIDPSTPDLTGRVMESLGRLGFRVGDGGPIDRVVKFMRKRQEPDGSWFGRWGVNYIYGTWQALTGMTAVGVPTNDSAIRAGANWLLSHQQPCGGWGETPMSYDDPSLRGQGPPTASQTAWAVMGLIAAGHLQNKAVYRGVRFLLNRQNDDGVWDEPEFTGTGFPSVFYLRYHYYSKYFPLMAISMYATQRD